MEYLGVQNIKKQYASVLLEKDEPKRALAVSRKEFQEPIFEGFSAHPDSEPSIDKINEALDDITADITGLSAEIATAASNYDSLISRTVSRLNLIEKRLKAEAERIQDINIICGNSNDFTNVVQMTGEKWGGTATVYDNNAFCAKETISREVSLKVISCTGNGYAGNDYVYQNEQFLSSQYDTASFEHLVDGNSSTAFEYSRITCSDQSIKTYPSEVNFDNLEAECSIVFYGATSFGALRLTSDMKNILVTEIATSDDGSNFEVCDDTVYVINGDDAKYGISSTGKYSANILTFPYTHYVRIKLRSCGGTTEGIAYEKNDAIITIPKAKRHVIRLTKVEGVSAAYSYAEMESVEILASPASSFAIFANEIIPQHFEDDDYITYTAIVDGKEYPIVPINQQRAGTKVLRFNVDDTVSSVYVQPMQEKMKSIKLAIRITPGENGGTPFVADIKACIGREEEGS